MVTRGYPWLIFEDVPCRTCFVVDSMLKVTNLKIQSIENNMRTAISCANTADTVVINESGVRKHFANLKTANLAKATLPDVLSNIFIKTCSCQLALVFTPVFQRTLDEGPIPEIWKTSIITPVPKTNMVSVLNDYRSHQMS